MSSVAGKHSSTFGIQNGLKQGDALLPLHKHLSETFPIQNGLKYGNTLLPLLSTFHLEYSKSQSKSQGNVTEWARILSVKPHDVNMLSKTFFLLLKCQFTMYLTV
jgi:hypothetical protein